jgi:hypothetical protein
MSLVNRIRLREHIMALQDMADTAALARAGTALPSLEDLAAGCPFFGDDVVKDAQKSASDLLAELAQMAQEYGEMYAPAPARIQAAMRAYADRPTPEIAHGLRDLVLRWRAGFKATSTHHWLHGHPTGSTFTCRNGEIARRQRGSRPTSPRMLCGSNARHDCSTRWASPTRA